MEWKNPREMWESHYLRMQQGSSPMNPRWVEA